MLNIKFKKLEIILLSIIVLMGAFLFLFRLSQNPPGLYVDEAATGYNAYSILKTGKDEYGKAYPMAFRLLGSYSPPLYIYFSVPLVAIFGLTVFSVRLLSVISGCILIIVFFFIVKELEITKSKITPLIATLFFAVTPWLVFFSRLGYEQNLAFLFFSLSVLLIIRSIKNPKFLILAIPLLSLATYADYAQRLLAPLLFLCVIILFWKKFLIRKNIKYIFIGALIAALIQIPNLRMINTASFYTKKNLFNSSIVSDQALKIEHYLPSSLAVPLSFSREFLSKYITYFSPRSLFFLPDPDPQRSIPELSVFYPWMLIPYLVGIYFFLRDRRKISTKLIFALLLITPIPGALTPDPFHIQRTLTLLLPLFLIITIGIDKILTYKKSRIWIPVGLVLFILSIGMLYRSYFSVLPQTRATIWGFEFPAFSTYIKNHPNKIFIIDQSSRTKPQDLAYIQLAFYLKLDPKKLQADQNPNIVNNYYNDINFSFIHKFENIEAKQIEWGETVWRNVIIVGDAVSISNLEIGLHNLTQVFEIRDPNGQIVLRGFQTNPTRLTQ